MRPADLVLRRALLSLIIESCRATGVGILQGERVF